VDTSAVSFLEEGKLGTYFVESATPPRPTMVMYDRAGSAAAEMRVEEMNWEYLLDTKILHLTGITAALSASCRELVISAIRRAKARGVTVSFDVNYRSKLWTAKEARSALTGLIGGVDVVFCSYRDAKEIFGLSGSTRQVLSGLRRLSAARWIVMTVGEDGVLALDSDLELAQKALPVAIVDRPGAGDALAGGVLSGLLRGSLDEGLLDGSALAALALSQVGDMVITNRREVDSILAGSAAQIHR
jgi:2-dehydro-3-deoxygluconokinase